VDIPKIHMIVSGDWMQIYFDGKSVYEHHWPTVDEMLDLLGIKYEYENVSDEVMTQIATPRRGTRKSLEEVKQQIDQITGNERFDPNDY